MQPVFATNKRTGIVRDGRRFAQGGATFGTGAAVPTAGNKDSDYVIDQLLAATHFYAFSVVRARAKYPYARYAAV